MVGAETQKLAVSFYTRMFLSVDFLFLFYYCFVVLFSLLFFFSFSNLHAKDKIVIQNVEL